MGCSHNLWNLCLTPQPHSPPRHRSSGDRALSGARAPAPPVGYPHAVSVAEIPRVRARFTGIRITWFVTLALALVFHSRYRVVPDVFIVACIVASFARPRWRRLWLPVAALLGWLALHASPYDVSYLTRAGRPKFMRLQFGYPSHEAIEAANRGELVLGGCLVSGLEPRWIVVW